MRKNKTLKFNKLLIAIFVCLQISCNSENQNKDTKNNNSQTLQ